MARYWLRRPEFEGFEFTGDIPALLEWSLAQDISGTETIVKRIVPYGENGFQYLMAWDWTPDQEWVGQNGQLGDFVVSEYGALNVRPAADFFANYEPVVTEPETPEGQ